MVGSCGRGESPVFPVLWATRKGLASRPAAVDVPGDESCLFSFWSACFCSVSVRQEGCLDCGPVC